jgi:hypothetical protein
VRVRPCQKIGVGVVVIERDDIGESVHGAPRRSSCPPRPRRSTCLRPGEMKTGCAFGVTNVCSIPMNRFYELENWRRSLVMLPPGSLALDREDAVALIAELQEAEGQLRGLRDALKLLLPMDGD